MSSHAQVEGTEKGAPSYTHVDAISFPAYLVANLRLLRLQLLLNPLIRSHLLLRLIIHLRNRRQMLIDECHLFHLLCLPRRLGLDVGQFLLPPRLALL